MKKFFVVSVVVTTAAALVSCQKQESEAEKNAEVERQVQERLAAEHQTQQQQTLDQRQADLDAREKALASKENPAAPAEAEERTESESTRTRSRTSAPRERAISVGYSTFYNKLESYGDWIETGDYGYVFHPREATSARWRPYGNGRWVYTDAGWTWISEEPFGWATYHYGRWTRLRGIGWVWVPGNQWAPAWVSWRKSNDYVGWAPLPPEARFDQRSGIHNWADNYYDIGPDQYCFVASREFGAPRVEQTLLPPERNVTIINQTTNVTNITYNNTTIVNEGPNYDELRSISREPVQRYRLERNVNVDLAGAPPRPEVRGETVVVAAPVIAQPVANERPPTVKQTIATAAVDLGWAAIANPEEAKKTREKMKSEAAPPPNAPPKKFVKAETTTRATAESAETSTPSTQTSSATATVAPSAAPTTAPVATAAPASSPSPASSRRGRLPVPTATASQTKPAETPRQQSESSPAAKDAIPSTQITAPPESSPLAATTSSPSGKMTRGNFKSQAQRFQPQKVEPLPSATAEPSKVGSTGKGFTVPNEAAGSSPNATPASSNAVASPSATAVERLTKQEKKEQKREEKQELKRERKAGNAPVSPSPAP
jgi:hypothetical protein